MVQDAIGREGAAAPVHHSLGLYFFSALEGAPGPEAPDDAAAYHLLIDAAVSADELGLDFVWVPERHFTPFGGGHPNPAVIAAALAVRTRRVRIRAGSVVLPLHDPLRVAEEWAVVDNLSNGRVEISSATGWNPKDFVLAPDAFIDRAHRARQNLATVQDLWSGKEISRAGPDGVEYPVRTYPRPVQPSLPYWITAAGNPDTFVYAGEAGAGVLTSYGLFPADRLAELIATYRSAYAAHHEGQGRVAVMAHTAIGEDGAAIRHHAESPLRTYLAAYLNQQDGQADVAVREKILDLAVQRYLHGRSLIGDPTEVLAGIRQMHATGADEIACLVDFGLPRETVLHTVSELAQLRSDAAEPA
ncbi:MupA/Atu3671 family FMN-dependent luciferase-like monooxygenase [Streptomyces sp. NPDC059802]|uniref:MupA/Atu3671 family FMN-dependent luciferase-like monooxygenase n=1 Tax=Streptomyces sp. NPDC059802 TaxID=3346952 RepID=UPI0036664B6F